MLHPVEIGLEEEILLRPLAEAENVGPEVVCVADIIGALQQRVDQVGSLDRRLGVEKGSRFIECWNPASQFQKDAANKLRVGKRFARCGGMLLPMFLQERVDLSGGSGNFFASRAVNCGHLHDRSLGLFQDGRGKFAKRLRGRFIPSCLSCLVGLGRRVWFAISGRCY